MSKGDALIVWPDGVKARIRGGKHINTLSYQVACAGAGCVMCGSTPGLMINDESYCNKCQHDYWVMRRMNYRGGLETTIKTMGKIYAQKQVKL